MQHRKFPGGSRSATNWRVKRWLSDSKLTRSLAILGLMTLAIASLMLTRQAISTAQAQQATQISDTASWFEANAAESKNPAIKKEVKQEKIGNNTVEPIIQGAAGCGWTAGTVYPITVLDNATASTGTTLYSFAGVSTTIIDSSYKFDGTTWTPIASLPTALEKPAAATDGTSVYIVGGVVGTGDAVNTLYRYNLATNDYTTLAPAPTATWSSAAVYLNGKIYKITGANSVGGSSTGSSAVEIYDIASNTWTSAASYPAALGFVSAFALNNYVYVAGGVDFVSGTGSAKTYRYDPAANTWDDASIADLPADRWGSAYDVYNGGAVLADGYVGGIISNTAVKWQPGTNTWVNLPNSLQARGRLAGGVAGGSFFAIGGRSSAGGFGGTNDNQKLFCPPLTDPFITGTVAFVSDSGGNGVADPGETITVSLTLQNIGGGDSGMVTATLQASGGIVPVTTSQSYGVLTAGGAPVSHNFTFTIPANAACGSMITLTFTVTDGTTTTTVTKTYTLGTLQTSLNENFDGVTAPALPAGWTVQTASGNAWVTTTMTPDSPPNAAFADDPGAVTDKSLVSPAVTIGTTGTATSQLTFRNSYNTENTFDGMVLEVSTDGGTTFQDIIAAGGTFVAGGYNGTISSNFMSPIGGRMAWTGNSNGYIDSTVTLPASLNGQSVKFRWRMASDSSVAATGVFIDNVKVFGSYSCQTGSTTPTNSRADFDGDGKTDISVFRDGNWYVQRSTDGFAGVQWGATGDVIVPGDYDGDNKTDYAVYRSSATPGVADFYVLNSATGTYTGVEWGTTGDVARVGDFDGDNKDDFAVYRSSDNTWYILPSGGGAPVFYTVGTAGGTAVALDYDGDGKTDVASWDPATGNWTIRQSTDSSVVTVQWGATGDKLVPADYDGDNKDDLAVFRNGTWLIRLSTTGMLRSVAFGLDTDTPVPGDYDGDGSDDVAVFRSGTWYINGSTSGFQAVQFGVASDIPVPTAYIP